jgi:flavodoxin
MHIHAIYASTSGNVETVVEKVAELLRAKNIEVELHRAEQTDSSIFNQGEHFFLATSTWEHGVLNPFFQKLHKEMMKLSFSGKTAFFVGLGDTRYEPVRFCEGMDILKTTWLDNGGQEWGHALKINGEPYHQLETTVAKWVENLYDEAVQKQVVVAHV